MGCDKRLIKCIVVKISEVVIIEVMVVCNVVNFLRFSVKSVLNIMLWKVYFLVIVIINESNNEIKNWYMWFWKKISRNIIVRFKGRLFFFNIDMILMGS